MSSGAVVVAPVGLPVVAAGAVLAAGAIAVTAGAVLVARAVNAAAESAVRAIGESGAQLEADIAAIEAAEEAEQWRRRAVTDVVVVNARLRLVRERAERAGVALEVPRPLALSAEISPARAVQWVSEVEREIARLSAKLDAAAPPLRITVSGKTGLADADLTAELDRHRHAAARRHATRPAAVATSSITDVISLLDPDATASERDEVLAAAAAISGRDEPSLYLSDLRTTVVDTLNPRVRSRRLAATWVAALDDGPLAEVVAGIDPPARLRGTADALREVVAGTRELTPRLRAEGTDLAAWAEDVAGRAFVRELVRKCLNESGHEVLDTFDGEGYTGLRLARADWGDQHSTVVRVRDGNIIEHHLESTRAPRGDSDELVDQERCAIANAGIQAVADAAAAAGVRVRLQESPPQQVSTAWRVPESWHTSTSDTKDDIDTERPRLRERDSR
ncbi:hypothetical protein [Actinokineospora globicatena]|uniref:hypothetical protein n=1 Tax=Actinokineospora globicatena TaxID=103729 RepID=UPI0020A392FD|nr:hypothetical protein [Actinokineospora globicatena]MCP2302886.1 hypothetical protein [Actinokineospora globicatena]GLW78731.1 hypothetical protein Aglo01_32130 [Actinokineospora globicatena]GLW84601.1 hypothetical protein Aglo02_22410 [Actinokineospora globicatena]